MRVVNARHILWKSQPDSKKVCACVHPQIQQENRRLSIGEQTANAKVKAEKQMRPGQPPDRIVRGSLNLAFPPLGAARRLVPVRQRSPWSATFTSTGCRSVIRRITALQPLRWPADQPAQRSRKWRRPQCPGQPARTRARIRIPPGNSPSRIASCHQRHRNHRLANLRVRTCSLETL